MWVVYALLSAFFVATTDPIAKKVLSKNNDEYLVGWMALLLSTPFLAIFYFSHRTAPFNAALVKTLLLVLPFEVLAAILYYKALKAADISLSVPFLALTPVFTIGTAFFLLRERVHALGIAGIVLITAGVYSLNLREAKYGFVNPIKAVFINKGSFYMALVALIFSVTSTMSKKAMLLSSPESIPFIYNLSISLVMAPLILYRLNKRHSVLNREARTILCYIGLGFFAALSSIFYFKSVSLANVAYAVSIKRLSLLMSVAYGWFFFKEGDIHIRFFSTLCMLAGVVFIVISG